ncbi:MAG: ROK family transcriptional regulator [Chloroflexi bacterium]|nr:ROK family transcriptional regulator [Chloroflexota bacterium]
MPERAQARTGDQALVREINLALIMQRLRENAPISRAALAEMTGLNKSTVSSLVQELISSRFVHEIGRTANNIGRPSTLLQINPSAGYIVSAEIGVDFIAAACANFAADVIWQHRQDTVSDHSQTSIMTRLRKLLTQAIKAGRRQGLERPLGLALGIPGLVEQETGILLFAPNLHWENVPLRAMLQVTFPTIPIFVDNEANLAALGEHFYGAARGYDTVLYISAGVGLGGAIVTGSRLFKGKLGFASEFGHMTFDADGERCNCGNRGCWETFVSQSVVFRAVRQAVESGRPSLICDWIGSDWNRLTMTMVLDAARRADPVALAALDTIGHNLGIGIASLVNALNPDRVVFGGTLSLAGDFLLPAVQAELHTRALRWNADATSVALARYGADACVMGGIAVVHQSIFTHSLATR